MPIKSRAQRRKFAELLMKGEISEEVYERWNRQAGYKELPEHVKPKAKSKAKRTKAKPRGKATSKAKARRKTTKKKTTSARKTTKRSRR
ncbi:MAG TPA: hypothetical protein VGR85_03465 [Candidatus Limnocylindria bacterium]|jgi:hypothetical protein|nr:hypothetical protein [Candidatus Limnocylindria bacterium]